MTFKVFLVFRQSQAFQPVPDLLNSPIWNHVTWKTINGKATMIIYQRERNNHSLFYPCLFSAITLCQRAWMCKKNYSIKFSSYCHLSLWFRYRLGTGHKVQEGGKADWKKIDNKIIISSPPLGKCITKRSPPKNPHKKKAITPPLKSSRCNVFR